MWTDAVRVCRPHAAGERLVDRMILQHCARFGLGVRGARTCGMQAEPCSVISRRHQPVRRRIGSTKRCTFSVHLVPWVRWFLR